MTYRPQFAYPPAPEGWEDQDFEYWFDLSNLPAFQVVLTPGQSIEGIALQLERDAEYRWRGLEASDVAGSFLGLRFRTPDGTYMADDYAPVENFNSFPAGVPGLPGSEPVAFEPEIVCPPGAVVLLDVKNMV